MTFLKNKQQHLFYGIITVLLIIGWGITFYPPSFVEYLPQKTLCLFKNVTGQPCPACGTGHGLALLLDGKLLDAVMYNPFSVVVGGIGALLPFWLLTDAVRRKPSLYLTNEAVGGFLKSRTWLIVLLILLVLANWIWNFYKAY
jgi:hypothetical protein